MSKAPEIPLATIPYVDLSAMLRRLAHESGISASDLMQGLSASETLTWGDAIYTMVTPDRVRHALFCELETLYPGTGLDESMTLFRTAWNNTIRAFPAVGLLVNLEG